MICSWCKHVHQYPENAPDLGTCAPDGILADGTQCECAGEEAMGEFPNHPRIAGKPATFFEICLRILADKTAASYNGVLIDSFSASAVVKIRDAAREDLRDKYINLVNTLAEKHPALAMDRVWKFFK